MDSKLDFRVEEVELDKDKKQIFPDPDHGSSQTDKQGHLPCFQYSKVRRNTSIKVEPVR